MKLWSVRWKGVHGVVDVVATLFLGIRMRVDACKSCVEVGRHWLMFNWTWPWSEMS